MRKRLCIFAFVLFAAPVHAELTHGYWDVMFAPPHNEEVVGEYVGRWMSRFKLEWEFGNFRMDNEFRVVGGQEWQRPEVVGHGVDAWQNSDWGIDRMLPDMTHELSYAFGDSGFSIVTEYYYPFKLADDRLGRNYYWWTGVRVGW